MAEILYDTRAAWLALRARHVGASEVAALFGISPFHTALTLWHEKKGGADAQSVNGRMAEGLWLEPVIARRLMEREGWRVIKAQPYFTHPQVAGMGCTLDYWVEDPQRGPGVVEIKLVRWSQWKSRWSEQLPAPHVGLQVQHQLACTGFAWGGVGVTVVGEGPLDPLWYPITPDPELAAALGERITGFWRSVATEQPPPATGTEREYALLQRLYPTITPEARVIRDDPDLAQAAHDLRRAHDDKARDEHTITRCRTRLAAALGCASLLLLPGVGVRRKPHGKGWRFDVFDRTSPG